MLLLMQQPTTRATAIENQTWPRCQADKLTIVDRPTKRCASGANGCPLRADDRQSSPLIALADAVAGVMPKFSLVALALSLLVGCASGTITPLQPQSRVWLPDSAPATKAESAPLSATRAERAALQIVQLTGELHSLHVSARIAGATDVAQAMIRWRATLAGLAMAQSGGDVVGDKSISAAACHHALTPPVEVWSLAGVQRLPATGATRLESLLAQLPDAAFRGIDHATLLRPDGTRERLGVASWNRSRQQIAPGSRLLVELPDSRSPLGRSLFPGADEQRQLVNRQLPELLATVQVNHSSLCTLAP